MPAYWLLKSEPGSFSIEALAASPGQVTCWDGVRNYQARNFLRDGMKLGDLAIFYHSVNNPGAAGIVEIAREGYPDPSALDPASRYFDPKASPDNPIWYMVDVRLQLKFPRFVPLAALRMHSGLGGMQLLRKGSRLSVMPVAEREFAIVRELGLGG